MRVRFWGTRGSIAKPGPSTLRYGGNTSCVELRSKGGTLVVIDCGTGAHGLGQALLAEGPGPRRGHLLISHTHWDHIQGIPFFAPFFVQEDEWDIHAPWGIAQSLRDTLAGQMQYTYFPITLEQLGATIRYHDLVEGSFTIGEIKVRTLYLHHPALTLGYRLEADGVAVVYACDHEPYARPLASGEGEITGPDLRHAEFLRAADLVIHDGQYTAAEYAARAGWGHSTVEYAAAVCRLAGARRLAITHHDPLRDDDALDRLVADLRARTPADLELFAAAEGQVIELEPAASQPELALEDGVSATTPPPPLPKDQTALVVTPNPALAGTVAAGLEPDGIRVVRAESAAEALRLLQAAAPALILLARSLPDADGLKLARTIRNDGLPRALEVPIVLMGQQEETAACDGGGATDWLIEPFSSTYVRTRARAWLLRARCRWQPAPLPEDEAQRLAALHSLGILDTPPEERFDRLTRLAAALFDVPVALVSLVDHDRQWLKSRHGTSLEETSREVSFCAHAVVAREVMVVPDALLDPRFAGNPLVTGATRTRFYAGCPLFLPDGSCAGTLCIVDTRPRQLDDKGVRLLHDLATLVERELTAPR